MTSERFAVLLAGCCHERNNHVTLLCHKILLYNDPALVDDAFGIQVTPTGIVEMMNSAIKAGTGLIEIHTHPGAKGKVSFSAVDSAGHNEITKFAFSCLPEDSFYGSLVAGQRSLSGLLWTSASSVPVVISAFRIAGTGKSIYESAKKPVHFDENRYTRQVHLLGKEGQERIGSVRVGIVGLGGTGSIVARTLAYEGVRSFVLIDHDRIAVSNLNRLDGGTRWDVRFRRRKVRIARREILRIAPDADVQIVPKSLFTMQAFRAMADADILFGCTDNDATRLCMNEFSAAYLKPYIDMGSGIIAESGRVTEAGGRVTVVLPGQGCMLCANAVNTRMAGHELAPPELREVAVKRGYVSGSDIPAPSVMSLNQTMASIAVTEFKAVVTGFRAPVRNVLYDLLSGTVTPVRYDVGPNCLVCHSSLGKGDLMKLQTRYCNNR